MGNQCPQSALPSSNGGDKFVKLDDDNRQRQQNENHHQIQSEENHRKVVSDHYLLLWGCESEQEHCETIRESLHKVRSLQGKEGLSAINLEFQMWHNHNPSDDTCKCPKTSVMQDVSEIIPRNSTVSMQHQESLADSSLGNDDEDDDMDDDSEGFFQQDLDDDDGNDYFADTNEDYKHHESEHYLVPLKTSARQMEKEISITDLRGFGKNNSYNPNTKPRDSERSATTMFSLATHHSMASSNDVESNNMPCQLRLHHTSLNIPITSSNYHKFIAHGEMYNQVARLCMEAAQEIMVVEGNLEWREVTIPDGNNHNIDTDRIPNILVSKRPTPYAQVNNPDKKKTLLIITGKGQVRAGIFSRRHLMTTGMESASCLDYVKEGISRQMHIAILDPNCSGKGMQTVTQSLDYLLSQAGSDDEFYILAHSMAGSQLLRYLLHEKKQRHQQRALSPSLLLPKIKAIAFTDSNHNLQWTKDYPEITELLEGPASIYLKSHKQHDDEPKHLGQLQQEDDDSFWKHRFGSIKTVWAGTHEHALTNYTAREYIWDHFDGILEGDE